MEGYLNLDNDLPSQELIGNLNQGLKIGGYLIHTENPSNRSDLQLNDLGLPFYNQQSSNSMVDLDNKYLSLLEQNMQSAINLAPKSAIDSRFDFESHNNELWFSEFNGLWTSDTRASTGIEYHMNDNWMFSNYQSFLNSQTQSAASDSSSIGLEFNDWISLWLAYQLVNFDEPVITGTIDLHF